MLARTATGLVAALALLAACDLFTEPGDRVIGIIGVGEAGVFGTGSASLDDDTLSDPFDLRALEAPDTVDAGAPFEIVVRTLDCCPQVVADGASVTTGPTGVEVVPYDRTTAGGIDPSGRRLPRTVTLTLHEPGEVLLRVTGRVILGGDEVVQEALQSIEHTIIVLP